MEMTLGGELRGGLGRMINACVGGVNVRVNRVNEIPIITQKL